MSQLRFCGAGGQLVGGKGRLPDDPCEHDYGGCNRLFCPSCQALVRWGPPGLRIKPSVTFPDHKALFASAAWTGLKFVEQTTGLNRRLYTCGCTHWETTTSVYVDNDGESPSDPRVPWRCAGHPVPSLPLQLDHGLTVSADTDWDALVDTILRGACPRPLSIQHEGPSIWLAWLAHHLAGLPSTQQLSTAIARRIDDPDPAVVGAVLAFFSGRPRAAGVEHVLARADGAIGVAVGYPLFEGTCPTLWRVVIERLKSREKVRDAIDERAAEVFRSAVLVPSLSHHDMRSRVELARERMVQSGWDLDGDLAKAWLAADAKPREDVVAKTFAESMDSRAFDDDGDLLWLADHVVEIDAAGPGRWRPLMNRLVQMLRPESERDHIVLIAGTRLLEGGQVDPEALRAWMKERASKNDAWALPLGLKLADKTEQRPS